MCKCNKKELGCPITYKDYKDYTAEDLTVKRDKRYELDLNAGFISRSDIVIKLTVPAKYRGFSLYYNTGNFDSEYNIREGFIWHVLDEGSKLAITDNLNFQGVEGDVELFADIQNGQIANVIVQPVHEAIRFIYPVKEILPKVNKHKIGCCDTCKCDETHTVSEDDECDETELRYPGSSGKFSIKLDIPDFYTNKIGKFNICEGFIWRVLDTSSKLAIIDKLITNNVEGDVELFAKFKNDKLEGIIVETKTGIEFVYPVKDIVNE